MAKDTPDWAQPHKGDSSLPFPSSSPSSPTSRSTRKLPRWAIALVTLAATASLYSQYGPAVPSTAQADDRSLGRLFNSIRTAQGLPSQAGGCPHAQSKHAGKKALTREEVEQVLLTVPTAEGARKASHSYTFQTHVSGTPGDHNVALLLKSQWESLLGLDESGSKQQWDAGTDEDFEALTGEKKQKKGKKHHHDWSSSSSPSSKAKRTARQLLRRAGLPVPSFLARRHHHEKKPSSSPRVWTSAYYPLLNYPVSSSVIYTPSEAEGGEIYVANLGEDVFEKDPTSGEGVKAWHGLSQGGTAKGKLVYASRGTPEDFAELASKGISVKDAIVLVQYGGLFRGLKIKAAAEAGAKAVLIYTDPIEDGEVTVENGFEQYPEGPARAESSVQRGSVQYLSLYPGDPLTPSTPAYNPSLPSSPSRLPRNSSSVNIPSIPSIPISYRAALPLLRALNRKGVKLEDGREGKPQGWREGGLGSKGVEYFSGPSEGEIEVTNKVDEKVTAIWNTYALIPGTLPDEVVVLGNHHDAWTFGSGDPSSGTAAVHEIVKALGELGRKGWKPLRTVLVAAWDGEEYGLIGSTEFGEDFSEWLQERVVAYLNVDVAASGSVYDLAASPSLAPLLREVSARIEDPDREGKTLADAREGPEEEEADGLMTAEGLGGEGELKVGALGSGSDFTVFLQRLGLASANVGYRRGSKDPVYHYHSNYDSAYWQDTFGDPSFKRHEAISKVLALTLERLADDVVLPINTTAYAKALDLYVAKISTLPSSEELNLNRLSSLSYSITHASKALLSRASKLQHALLSPELKKRDAVKLMKELKGINKRLRRFEGGFLSRDGKGLEGREWYKHLGVAPGRWLGYGATTLPGLTEALTLDKDVNKAKVEVKRLEEVFEAILKGLK